VAVDGEFKEYIRLSTYRNVGAFLLHKKKVFKIEEVRCKHCNQLLLKADYVSGEIKCPRCNKINNIKIQRTEPRATP